MKPINEMELKFKSLSVNESFARATVAGFCLQINPTIDELTDIKTAVSEAVTNCVVHAYPNCVGDVTIKMKLYPDCVDLEIVDNGVGIDDFEKAREPFYTTKPEQERSGMGFTVMESFVDEVVLAKNKGGGLVVRLKKQIANDNLKIGLLK